MSQDIEKQVDQLNQELRIVFEKQGRNNRLFNRVLETWHGDKEVSNFFMNKLQESQHIERKLTFELENQKETLLKERRNLIDLETDLTYRQQRLKREDKA